MQERKWFITKHDAWSPQTPGQGSLHLFLTQAKWFAHSWLMEHSGLHSIYGSPSRPGIHVHAAALLLSLQTALIPQGLGLQGSTISGLIEVAKVKWRCENCQDWFFDLLVILEHWLKGSPSYPWLQIQRGIWFLTLQKAFSPHKPGQGSAHFLEMQARLGLQSAFKTHSGLQFGGLPIRFGRHEHWHLSPTTRGILEFGPHGFGSHGFSAMIGSVAKICLM